MKLFIVAIFCSSSLISCFRFTLVDANAIQKGMARSEVAKIVTKGPVKEFEIRLNSAQSNKYFVQFYEIASGGFLSDYFAVYENDKLLYWGYPYEFNRHPDTKLNEIGKELVAEFEKIKKEM